MKNKKNVSFQSILVVAIIIVGAYFFASGKIGNIERSINQSDFPAGQQLPAQAGSLGTPNVTGTALTCTSAKLTWNSVSGAKGYEVYGPSSVCNVSGSAGYCGKTSKTTLTKTITGLVQNTSYANLNPTMEGFTVLAYSGRNYSAPSPRVNIQTPPCGGSTLPTVTITSHSSPVTVNTSTFSGLAGVSTNATSVKYFFNNVAPITASGVSPWSASPIPLALGNTVVTVIAYDSLGNQSAPAFITIEYVSIALENEPPVTSTASPSSSWANTNIARTLTCTDGPIGSATGCGTTYWKFVSTGTSCGTGPSGYSTGTSATTNTQGQWRLCYYSVDNGGNIESPVKYLETFKLDSTAPTGNMTAPTSGQTVSGTTTLSANASDGLSGVASVDFKIDGATVGSDSTSPYSFSWNSAGVSNGSHTATATITDVAGNSITTPSISFTVSNTTSGLSTPTNLSVTGLTCNSFTLNWNAVATATGYEVYGPLNCNGSGASNDFCGSTSGTSRLISGLTPSTTYNFNGPNSAVSGFAVLAYNSSAYSAPQSTRLSVTTPSCGNTAPVITITSPTSNASYTSTSSSINLGGTATDDVSVSSITWRNQLTGASGSATIQTGTTWAITGISLSSGVNTITVTATDGAGLTGTDSIDVSYNISTSALPWPASNTGSQIGGSLTSLFEPSGAFWNSADQMLYFASDHGMVTRMDQNGGNLTNWSISGNFEGITGTGGNSTYPTSMDKVYVVDENTSQIKEIGPTGSITKTWTLPSNVTIGLDPGNNLGAEGIAWVPNGDHPYANSTSGGLFYIGSQMNGTIYAVDVNLASSSGTLPTSALKGTIQPQLLTSGTPNISDLSYAPSTNKLFVIYDGLNIIHEMRPNGLFVSEYRLPVVSGASGEEGIATIPTCNGSQTAIVLGYDPASAHNVYKFNNYPQPCADSVGPVITNNSATTTATSSTITWDTNEWADSKLEYGTSTSYGTTLSSTLLKTTSHTAIIANGLTAGVTYQYRITSKDQAGNSAQKTGSFTTSSGSGTSNTIIAAGDIACGYCAQMQVSNWIMANIASIDKVLVLGDAAYDNGTLSEFNGTYAPSWGRSAIKAKTTPVPGNHEYGTSGAAGYFDYFNGVGVNTGQAGTRGQGYYSYNLGAWHIIALNSQSGSAPSSSQLSWLDNDLATNSSLCTIAMTHHPRFSNGDHGDDSDMQGFWSRLAANNVEMLLSGHDHGYERMKPRSSSGSVVTNGVRQFIVGTGGTVNFYNVASNSTVQDARVNNTNGVLKLTLHPTSYDFQFIRTSDGAVLDSGSANCY